MSEIATSCAMSTIIRDDETEYSTHLAGFRPRRGRRRVGAATQWTPSAQGGRGREGCGDRGAGRALEQPHEILGRECRVAPASQPGVREWGHGLSRRHENVLLRLLDIRIGVRECSGARGENSTYDHTVSTAGPDRPGVSAARPAAERWGRPPTARLCGREGGLRWTERASNASTPRPDRPSGGGSRVARSTRSRTPTRRTHRWCWPMSAGTSDTTRPRT